MGESSSIVSTTLLASITAVSAFAASLLVYLSSRDKLKHDVELVLLHRENDHLRQENDRLTKLSNKDRK